MVHSIFCYSSAYRVVLVFIFICGILFNNTSSLSLPSSSNHLRLRSSVSQFSLPTTFIKLESNHNFYRKNTIVTAPSSLFSKQSSSNNNNNNHHHKQKKLRLLSSFPSSSSLIATDMLQYIGLTAKYVVSGIAAFSLFSQHTSVIPLYYIVCALLNAIFGKVLKSVIKEPRPKLSPKSGFGMPSSHTASITYFGYIVIHTCPYFLPFLLSKSGNPAMMLVDKVTLDKYQKIIALLVTFYGISACYWRIVTHLHTTTQIFAGFLLGLTSAILATRQESTAVASFSSLLSGKSSSAGISSSLALVYVVKVILVLLIVPVVFKTEVKWLRANMKGSKRRGTSPLNSSDNSSDHAEGKSEKRTH